MPHYANFYMVNISYKHCPYNFTTNIKIKANILPKAQPVYCYRFLCMHTLKTSRQAATYIKIIFAKFAKLNSVLQLSATSEAINCIDNVPTINYN